MKAKKNQNLSKQDRVLTVFYTQLSALVNSVQLILPDIAKDQDIEFLHQYRVSLRKVVALLVVFHNFVPKKILLKMKTDSKSLFEASGQLRDLDLLLNKFQQVNLKNKHKSPDKTLVQEIMAKRLEEFKRFLLSTQSREYKDRFVRLQACLNKIKHLNTQVTLNDCWPNLIKQSMQNVHTVYKKLWKQKDDPHIHKLRKNLKQLRYCIELFGVLVKPRKAKTVLSWLKIQQESLGNYNDLQVQSGLLKGHERANKKIKQVLKTGDLTEMRKSLPLSKSDWKILSKKIQPLAG